MYWLDKRLINQLSGLNQLFGELDRSFGSAPRERSSTAAFPKLNAWKNDNSILLTAEVPGVDPQDIELEVQPDKLTISGERHGRAKVEGDSYQRSERSTGKFRRELTLPFRVDSDKVSASCKNGILSISLALAAEEKPKRISVTVRND